MGGALVIAVGKISANNCGDAPELLEFVEEPLDKIALAIKGIIARALDFTIGLWRNDNLCACRQNPLDNGIAVISFVGQHGIDIDSFEQFGGLGAIMRLPLGEAETGRIAKSIAAGVNFTGQPSPASADGFPLAVFFLAPALC